MEQAWFRKEGFYSNPFSIKPAAFHDEIIGYKLEPIMQKIDAGAVLFIEAPLGSGKTTLTKRIIRNLKGKARVIYCSHLHSERINAEKLLRGASFSAKVFGMLPKGAIMLVDEAAGIGIEDGDEILKYLEQGNLKSAVFFGTKYLPSKFPEGLSKLINGNVVKISYLTPEQAVQVIRRRIGNLRLISDDVIRQAFVRVNYNPRRLLEACEDICREAASGKAAKAEIVEKVLGNITPVKASKVAKKRSKKAVKKQPSGNVLIHEVHVGTQDNFDLKNIRTYEEEMELIKQQAEEEKEA